MGKKYGSLRNMVCQYKDHPDFKSLIAKRIFRWANDKSLTLDEFYFLARKALNYISP